jgi:hypothetical protein
MKLLPLMVAPTAQVTEPQMRGGVKEYPICEGDNENVPDAMVLREKNPPLSVVVLAAVEGVTRTFIVTPETDAPLTIPDNVDCRQTGRLPNMVLV